MVEDNKIYFDLLDQLKHIDKDYHKEKTMYGSFKEKYSMIFILKYIYFCNMTTQVIFNKIDEIEVNILCRNYYHYHGVINVIQGYSLLNDKQKNMLHKVAKLSYIIN